MCLRRFNIEKIPNFAAWVYALIARKNPCLRDAHIEIAKEICAKVSSGRVLDVGTGPGYLPFEIAKRAPGVEITGIDLSSAMVEMAIRKSRELGFFQRVKFQVASAGSLPFEQGYFDLAVSSLSLHHWLKPAEYLKEISRVLKENGKVYIYELRKNIPKEVRAQLQKKYGWLLAFIFVKVARIHSISLGEAERIISSLGAEFSGKSVREEGVLLKFEMIK
jgi:ubiquinone/menaquinone biosynthesis C-methylase UbiE